MYLCIYDWRNEFAYFGQAIDASIGYFYGGMVR